MGSIWTIEDATKSLSAVVEAAKKGEPQRVTTADGEAVVVVAAQDYELMLRRPKTFVEHIFSAPKLPDDCQDLFDKKEPLILEMREIDFDD